MTLTELIDQLTELRDKTDPDTPVVIGARTAEEAYTVLGVADVRLDVPPGMSGMRHRRASVVILSEEITRLIRPATVTR